VRTRPATYEVSERLRAPGSDWLYVALDGPRRTEDELLTGTLGELLDSFVLRGQAEGWYVVRYADPAPQLRVRLCGRPATLVDRVLPELARWAAASIASGTRTRLSLQPYERELERYGGPETTAVCEAVACVDSAAVRSLLSLVRPRQGREEVDRVELGLVSAADLLASLARGDPARRARWAKALGAGVPEAAPVFRQRKVRLRALVHAVDARATDGLGPPGGQLGGAWAGALPCVGEVLTGRRAALAPLARALDRHWTDGSGSGSPEELAASILHLHANRLGLDRPGERLMLGLLDRTLRSLAAFDVVGD